MHCEWQEKKLSELITVKHGFAFKGEHFSDSPTAYILATPGNFALGGGFRVGKKKYYSGPIPSDYLLKVGDLLTTMTDLSKQADTLGYSAVVPSGLCENYLHNQRVGLVKVRPDALALKQWIYYLMRTPAYRNWIVSSATGSTVRHTSPTKIGEFTALVPSVATQKRVANILDSLENTIENLCHQNTALESVAQTLFRSWFVNFDPVHARAAGNAPEAMSAELAELFPSEFEESPLGLIPKGWSWQGVDHSITYLNGLALQKYPVVEGEPTLPILKISQLRAGRTDPKVLSNRKMKSEFIVKDGDIIFSWSGSLEVRIWTGGDAALNQHLFKVFSEKHPAWFCYQATQHHLPSFRETAASKATTMGHIQRRHLSEAKVAVCPPSLMAKLNDIFVPMQKTVVLNGQLIREIEQLRDHLLPRLISGKLSIGEAEKAVAELLPEPVEAI